MTQESAPSARSAALAAANPRRRRHRPRRRARRWRDRGDRHGLGRQGLARSRRDRDGARRHDRAGAEHARVHDRVLVSADATRATSTSSARRRGRPSGRSRRSTRPTPPASSRSSRRSGTGARHRARGSCSTPPATSSPTSTWSRARRACASRSRTATTCAREGHRLGRLDRSRRAQGRPARERPAPAAARRLVERRGRRLRRRDRQPVRARPHADRGHHLGRPPPDLGAERASRSTTRCRPTRRSTTATRAAR